MARLLLVGAFAFLAAACGGDEPTKDDAATFRVMLSTSADVQRAVQPLYFCFPEEPECYRQVGPQIVEAVVQARSATETVMAETDNTCLKEFAALYRDSLDAYADAGRAATAADTAAVDAAISETTRLEIAYGEKLGECGFEEGTLSEYSATLRKTDLEILRLSEELESCRNEACVLDGAARMKSAAVEGVRALDGMLEAVAEEDEAPPCLTAAIREFREAYVSLEKSMQALQAGNLATLEREAKRAGEQQAAGTERMASCMSAAGF